MNATQAAIRAGYSAKTAKQQGDRLLTYVDVSRAIQTELADRSKRTGITAERALVEVARLAFNDPRKAFDDNGNLLPIKKWPDEVAAAISSIESEEFFSGRGEDKINVGHIKKIKFWDKGKQLELVMKHLGLLLDRIDITSKGEAIKSYVGLSPEEWDQCQQQP